MPTIDQAAKVATDEGDFALVRIVEETTGSRGPVRIYHRTSCPIAEFEAQMGRVNSHLNRLGRAEVMATEIDRVKNDLERSAPVVSR